MTVDVCSCGSDPTCPHVEHAEKRPNNPETGK